MNIRFLLRVLLRTAVMLAIWVVTIILFINLQNAGVVSDRLAGIYLGAWNITAFYACFPSAPIPNR